MMNLDFLIVGSGFSGSITATALTKMGYSVCLIEKDQHPRFAIGESSTPIADMILRDLAEDYDIPFLNKLSRYGKWQKYYPEITCGLKRGFSYYFQKKGERFYTDENHSRKLLVAASENDDNSDTNWLRSDVDHFLVKKAVKLGVVYFDQTRVQKLSRDSQDEKWIIDLESQNAIQELECSWIIDATGSPAFSNFFFKTYSSSAEFKTQSSAIFTHFENVNPWYEYLNEHKFNTLSYPYNPDYSALHQIIEEGWMWMLRFNNNRLSAGILIDESNFSYLTTKHKDSSSLWKYIVKKYPSLDDLFKIAVFADVPNQFYRTDRLQRVLNRVYGNGWIALPHTAGFIDPLHSTGIAYTLSGVETILSLFSKNVNKENRMIKLKNYQDKIFNELRCIDLLVSMCYQSRTHFDLFKACTMLYFIASIRYENMRLGGNIPTTFLCAGDKIIRNIVQDTYDQINRIDFTTVTKSEIIQEIDAIRERIAPYNSVGLMDPQLNDMYTHTATVL